MIDKYLAEQIRQHFPYQPTAEQETAIKRLAEFLASPNPDGIFILRGYAGTGKTSLVGALVRTLDLLKQKSVLLAPTGRAAKVFASYAGHPAFTIHKKIYRQRSFSNELTNFTLNDNLTTHTLYIVDEASMISNEGLSGSTFGTGRLLDDHIEWAKFTQASWVKDGFFYSAYDAPVAGKEYSNVNENHKVYYHKVGTPQSADELVYENKAFPKRFYNIEADEDGTLLFLFESGEGAGNAIYVKNLRKPGASFVPMATDMDYQYSPVEVLDGKIYLFTNYGASKNRIMVTTPDRPDVKDWQELVPEKESVLAGASIIGGKLFSFRRDRWGRGLRGLF